MKLDWPELRTIVSLALRDFAACDLQLLKLDANERSITHKIGEYLRSVLDLRHGQDLTAPPLLAVDCEYNRFGPEGEPKRLPWDHVVLFGDGGTYYTPNPDIIIHRREYQDSNNLVVEAKSGEQPLSMAVLLDRLKLVGYLDYPTYYRFGLYLHLCIEDGKLLLSEAKLADPCIIKKLSTSKQTELWFAGRKLLVTDGTDKVRPALRRYSERLEKAASDMIPLFDKVYGLSDVREELS